MNRNPAPSSVFSPHNRISLGEEEKRELPGLREWGTDFLFYFLHILYPPSDLRREKGRKGGGIERKFLRDVKGGGGRDFKGSEKMEHGGLATVFRTKPRLRSLSFLFSSSVFFFSPPAPVEKEEYSTGEAMKKFIVA